jgi:hypothetical protein
MSVDAEKLRSFFMQTMQSLIFLAAGILMTTSFFESKNSSVHLQFIRRWTLFMSADNNYARI